MPFSLPLASNLSPKSHPHSPTLCIQTHSQAPSWLSLSSPVGLHEHEALNQGLSAAGHPHNKGKQCIKLDPFSPCTFNASPQVLLSTFNHPLPSFQPAPRTRCDHFMPSCRSGGCQLQPHVWSAGSHAKRLPTLGDPATAPQETQIKPQADAGQRGHSPYPPERAS